MKRLLKTLEMIIGYCNVLKALKDKAEHYKKSVHYTMYSNEEQRKIDIAKLNEQIQDVKDSINDLLKELNPIL